MRKWLVFTLAFAFLAAAVAAEAASVPSRLNGSTWQYSAFQFHVNGTANSFPAAVFGTQLKSTYAESDNGGWDAAKNIGGLNGTVHVWNATSGYAGANATWFNATGNGSVVDRNNWRAGQTFGTVNELLELHRQPGADYSTYFIANTDYSFMAAISNRTITGSDQGLVGGVSTGGLSDIGASLGLLVQNLTITNNVTDVAGTWNFYSISGNFTNSSGTLSPHHWVTAGQMTLTATGGGSLSYYSFNGSGTLGSGAGKAVTWGNWHDNQTISINATDIGELVSSGAISAGKNIIVGYNGTNVAYDSHSPVSTVIAMKSASTLSRSDFTNAGFKYAAVTKDGAIETTNATLGVFFTSATGAAVNTGNATTTNGTTLSSRTLDDVALNLAAATLSGVSHSNMTMGATATGANYYSTKMGSLIAGIMVDTANKAVGLQVMVPSGTVVSEPVKLSTAEVTTLSDTSTFTVTGSNGTAVVIEAGTDIGIESVGDGSLDTAINTFTNATDETIKSDYGLGSGAIIDRNFPTVKIGVTLGGPGRMLVRKMTFGGNNKLIRELAVPTKFYVKAVTTASGVTHAANTYKQFTYRNAGAAITDGSWWITPSGAPTVTLDYAFPTRLTLGQNYDLWLAIQDDGDFDLDPTDAQIVDPSGFVSGLGGGGGIGGSSSDSGCVLNPAAGLSVELLLLLLAPLAYFIRRKK